VHYLIRLGRNSPKLKYTYLKRLAQRLWAQILFLKILLNHKLYFGFSLPSGKAWEIDSLLKIYLKWRFS
jgi:hypothetical protein